MTTQDNRHKDAEDPSVGSGQDLRQKAETLAWEQAVQTPEDSAALSREEIREIIHELRVHQIELEMQNEELRTSQTRIEAGRVRYFDLYDLAPVGYCTLSEKGLIVEANLTAATLLGTARGDLIKQPISRFILNEDQDIYYLHRKKLLETSEPQECELRMVKPDGASFWAHLTATAARGEDGGPVCCCVINDITGRKGVEEAFHARETLLNATGEMARIGGWEVDSETQEVKWTEETYRIHEVPLSYRPLLEEAINFFHPEDREMLRHAIQRALDHGEPYDFEIRFITAKGNHLWTRTICQPQVVDGQTISLKGIFQDITERKRAFDNIKSANEKLQLAADSAHFGIWNLDIKDNLLEWDDWMFRLYGLNRENFCGAYEAWQASVHPDDIERSSKEVKQALSGEKEFDTEFRIVRPDGEVRRIKAHATVCRDSRGEPIKMTGINYDITERKLFEDALIQSEHKWRNILVNTPQIGISLNPQAKIVFVNTHFLKLTGWQEHEVIGQDWFDMFIPASVREQVREVFGAVMRQQDTLGYSTYENEIVTRSGDLRNVSWSNVLTKDAHRRIQNVTCLGIDLTERKQAEDALKESELFLENMSDIAYRADNQGNLVWVNSAGERITGLSRDDLIGKPFLPLFIEADHPSLMEVYKRTLIGESLENTLTFTSGVTCHFTSLPRRSANGDIVGTFGVARDISAQLEAQRALHTSEARLKKAQETARIGNWEYDIATGEVWGSEEAFRIYGIERTSEFLPLDEVESYILDAKNVNQALVDLITKRKVYDIEFQINSKAREGLTLIHSMADMVFDAEGNPVKVLGVIQDITEHRQAEVERENLQAQLHQAQKMEAVGRLAGGVAHDFNNMLGVILGHTEMALENVSPTEPLHADLTEIRKAGKRSADLTRQLLAFARKQTVAPKVLDLNEAVGGMLMMLHRLIGEDIALAWLPGEKGWLVKIDPGQVDQILANLCVNARDAIAGIGKMTIETGNTVFDEAYCHDHVGFVPGEYALLAVSDNGCGMDSETLSHIFEPFFTTKEPGKGSGLGLATVYGVVKQNNGFIHVYSAPGQGTTFRIYLPRHRAQEALLPDKEAIRPAARGHETILLVEDEPAMLKITTMMLKRKGYTVVGAGNPGEAIRLANEHAGNIHLLMTDVVMPEMNGRDLAKRILSLYPRLKSLFMSGYTANVIAHHGILDEGVNFIQKPFTMGELTLKVREVLDRD